MGKNMPNINPMSIIVYGCNQTGFIAANIKNRYIPHFISTRKNLPKLCKRIEICAFYDPMPGFKCSRTIRVFFFKLQQSPSSDDVHKETISHGEMFVNMKSQYKKWYKKGCKAGEVGIAKNLPCKNTPC